MPYPNTALSAWQLALVAVVAVSALAGWLVAVFLAARPSRADRAASAPTAAVGEREPAREADDRLAA